MVQAATIIRIGGQLRSTFQTRNARHYTHTHTHTHTPYHFTSPMPLASHYRV